MYPTHVSITSDVKPMFEHWNHIVPGDDYYKLDPLQDVSEPNITCGRVKEVEDAPQPYRAPGAKMY